MRHAQRRNVHDENLLDVVKLVQTLIFFLVEVLVQHLIGLCLFSARAKRMSICIMTGIGAAIGASIFTGEIDLTTFVFMKLIEGMAAGAMLTMIAKSMLPEAFHESGDRIGLVTLFGFLSALLVSILDQEFAGHDD